LVVLLLALPMACTTTIVPPTVARNPTPVALLDHGRHASIVLPADGDRMTRWAYGERRWYAERQTGPFRAVSTLLWPTQAALGRRGLPGPVSETNIRRRVVVPIESLWIIHVEPSRAQALQQELDALFRQHSDSQITNEAFDLDFVDHPQPYSYGHNSNHQVAEWLQRPGCDVQGPATDSAWQVKPHP